MWTVRADPFSGSWCPALIPAVGAVGGGKRPLQGACAPQGPRKPPSWISPSSLCLLLLIGIYLHKKDLCQDHHSSLVHMAQSRVCPEDWGGDLLGWTGGRRDGNCRAWCDQGLHPEPLARPVLGLVPGPAPPLPWAALGGAG